MSEQPAIPQLDEITATLDASYAALTEILARLRDPLSETPDDGGWTIRQTLSHVAGALLRVPVHSGFVLGGDGTVPLLIHDTYWLPEWETAPLRSFAMTIDAGYAAGKALLSTLQPADLERTAETPFGAMPYGAFLVLSYGIHLTRFHIPQLEAFAVAQG